MINAVGFRVLVEPDAVVEESQGGIVIVSDTKLEKGATTRGTVKSIGPEAFRAFNRNAGFEQYVPWVGVGDVVYYAKYSGKWIDDPDTGIEYLMINDEDIVGRYTADDVDAETTSD